MNKGHKQTQSFAGGAKGKGAPAKKPAAATHKPAQSTANAAADKKAPAKTHKPEAGKKAAVKTEDYKTEKTTPPAKTEKAAPAKTEKPATAAKTEKAATPAPAKERPSVSAAAPAKERPSVSSVSPTEAATSSVQSALESKKANDEKREMNKKVDALKKENIDLKKKLAEFDKLNNELMNEVTESQKSSEHFIKERNEMEEICKKAQEDLKLITQRNEELTKKVEELQDDLEIAKEESETQDLERQLLQKQFDEYKVKAETEIKRAKLNATKAPSGGAPSGEEGKTEADTTQNTASDNTASNEKIAELEDIINDLSNQLNSTSEQRDYAISYYKGEMEKLNKVIEELKDKALVITEKDDLIKQLTEKLKEDEGIIDSLKSQINVLSPANDMYEELIMEKDDLENQLEELKNENLQLKDSAKDNDEMINDLEEALQISEKVMKDSQNEALVLKNKLEEMEKKTKEYEDNQTELLSKIEDLKNKNKLLNDDTATLKGSSQNMKNIYIEYLTSKSIIQNLKRKTIISDIFEVDNDRFLLRNKIVKNMIPKKLLESGNIAAFDKFLNINSYRRKAFKLILNQLNNEILTDDLGINPNKLESEDDKMGKVEGDEKKKLISFYESAIDTFAEFYCYLLKMEIFLSDMNAEQFLKINADTSFNDTYHSIVGGSSIFDMILNAIKTDNFSIQNKPNIDGLKNINTQIKTEMANIENVQDNKMYLYLTNLLQYFCKICCGFKKERIDIIVDDLDKNDKLKSVADSFIDSNKTFNNLIEKLEPVFFKDFTYKLGNTTFDVENSYYQTLSKKNQEMENELNDKTEYDIKYASLIDTFNKVCVVMSSDLEKMDTTKNEEEEKIYEDDRVVLPIKEWNNITDALYGDLENITKVTEELDETRNKIEDEKMKNTELQSKYENLEKMKKENDDKLGELMVKLGKYSQLEASNDENAKKIQKYQIAVEGLQNTVNEYEKKEKEYLEKIEVLEKKDKEKRHMKKATGIDMEKLKLSNNTGEDEEQAINGAGLLNTVFLLQKERKNYKNKFMKEKLSKLMEDKDSYVNRYIKKDFKISRGDNEKEKEMYRNIQDKVISLNRGYDKIRQKLCFPKVLDLSNQEYNYEKEKKQQEDEIEKTRIKYMEDADSIFYHIFGENNNSKTIKEVVDSDISKTLSLYGDKKCLIGKLQFSDSQKGQGNQDLSGSLHTSTNTMGIPVIINEEGLKKINESFIYS